MDKTKMTWFEAVAKARKDGVFIGKVPKKNTTEYFKIIEIREGRKTKAKSKGKGKGKKEKEKVILVEGDELIEMN